MNLVIRVFAAATLFAVGLSANTVLSAHEIKSQSAIVSAYVDAYNAKDLEAMRALMHPDIQWIAVEGGKSEVVADGRDALVEQMTSYFASPSIPRSTFGDIIENGRFLVMRETAHWTNPKGEEKSQSSLAVYEIDKGLVRRVWYYPAQK